MSQSSASPVAGIAQHATAQGNHMLPQGTALQLASTDRTPPHLERHVVAGQDVAAAGREADVVDGGDDLAEEGARALQGECRVQEAGKFRCKPVGQRSGVAKGAGSFAIESRFTLPCQHLFLLGCIQPAGQHQTQPPPTAGSVSSNSLACWSQSAAARWSASRMRPLLLLYANTLQWCGW